MNHDTTRLVGAPWTADLGDGTYRNPILHADYSDPDVIRVGGDFFMAASSFHALPGLPILHSTDLVNWKLIGHVVPRLPFPRYDLPAHGKGIWAPALRHHDGVFYCYFSMPDEGLFMAHTTDPFGPWSPLVWVKKTAGWIDPCPFWDDDGCAYLVNAFANSRIGFKSVLRLNRMSPDGTELLTEGRFIFDGYPDHLTIEGPKLYKRNGWYYIFAPAGGVKHGWQTVLRSRNIWGPYEDRIVLHQGNTAVNGPHQGGWVELDNGESWFVHFQDRRAYGRIVHLQPLQWSFDWPLMGRDTNEDGIGEPVAVHLKPQTPPSVLTVPAASDSFDGRDLGLQWQWQANPQPDWIALRGSGEGLRLASFPVSAPGGPGLAAAGHVLAQKFAAPAFTFETAVDLTEGAAGDFAGLVVLGSSWCGLALQKTAAGFEIILVQGTGLPALPIEEPRFAAETSSATLGLRLTVETEARCRFAYQRGAEPWQTLDLEFQAQAGVWVGASVGLYAATRNPAPSGGWARFAAVKVTG